MVSSEEERTGRLIEQCKGKHPAEPSQASRSPSTPGFEHHLGVGARAEGGSAGDLGSDLPIV